MSKKPLDSDAVVLWSMIVGVILFEIVLAVLLVRVIWIYALPGGM
jgi:hypothetical protein